MVKKKDNLLETIENYYKKYIVLPNEDEFRVLSCFAIHTWAMEAAHTTPYLYAYSPEPGSGKTTLMEVVGSLCNTPEMTANITPPALAALVDTQECTLLFDELDQVFSSKSAGNKMLQGILNAGYKSNGVVYRTQGQGVRKIRVFCPKMLAGLSVGLPDTLLDRSIPIQLRRKRHDQKVEPFYASKIEDVTAPILDAIEAWVEDNLDNLSEYEAPDLEWSPRQVEIATPLLAIAKVFDCEDEVAGLIDNMIQTYKKDLSNRSASNDILRKVAELFYLNETTKVFTEDMLEWFELPNNTTGARKLSDMLSVYGVESSNVRIGNRRRKGFNLVDFAVHMDVAGLLDDEGQIKEDALS